MSEFDSLLSMIPIGDIAKKLGLDENLVKTAVAVAVPAIVGGLAANAKDADGAKSLENALGSHAGKSTKLDDIDEADGKKIVSHVFGTKKDDVVAAAATKAGGIDLGPIIAQILPIVAPIVLSWVATQFLGQKTATASKPAAAPATTSGGGIGDILGGLLGSKEGQDVLGGVLGGLLGGKK
ncbi:MAG: DUF937 domain-containing protein [Rhodoglobus sp.]